jgi:dihydrofolate reductase
MRKLIVHMMTTLDGFIADEPGTPGRLPGDWTNYDDEMRRFTADLFTATDTLMFGRGIYQEFVPHWTAVGNGDIPGDEHEVIFGGRVRDTRKIVVSTTLDQVPGDTTVLRGDLAAQVDALKAAPGSDILCYCGPDLLATLAGLGLIDEYMLYVHPLVIGRGVHLFGGLQGTVRLELARTRTFDSGTVLSYYRPR